MPPHALLLDVGIVFLAIISITIIISIPPLTMAMDNLNVVFEWKQIDFDFPTDAERQEAIARKEFIPANNLPLGLEVYGDRLFITVPRWKNGVVSSLNYINLTDTNKSPKLRPYPNWESHKFQSNGLPDIVSPFRIRADRCGHLWVLDCGMSDIISTGKVLSPPQILIYDLHNDALLRRYSIPAYQMNNNSFFANIAVEDHDCEDIYAYLGDLGKPAIVVYSWTRQTSWQITHNFFHIDPLAGEFNVSGQAFQWTDGVFGLALSKPAADGFSTLYFHPLTSTHEFAVNTRYLRGDNMMNDDNYRRFSVLGSRGPRGQSGVSFLHEKTDVLFYSLVNLNAVACWRTTNPAYTMESQGRVYMSNVTMVLPNDIKVDGNDNLWVLSNRLPIFMYAALDPDDVNFRILTAPVAEAIKGTACDSKLVLRPEIVDRIMPVISSSKEEKRLNSTAVRWTTTAKSIIVVVIVAIIISV